MKTMEVGYKINWTDHNWEKIWSTKGEMKILASRMPQMRLNALYSFITLYKKCMTISTKDPNVVRPPNVQFYNNSNQIFMDKLKDEMAEMLSVLIV